MTWDHWYLGEDNYRERFVNKKSFLGKSSSLSINWEWLIRAWDQLKIRCLGLGAVFDLSYGV